MSEDDERSRPASPGDRSDREPWYERESSGPRRPWERVLDDTGSDSLLELLREQREEGMTRGDLLLVGGGTLLLVLIPAALAAGILTLLVFPLIERHVLWWGALTVAVLVAMGLAVRLR